MRLCKLEIDSFRGIKDLSLTELGSGLHIVFGPNGSGKTSLCKAILKSIWPDQITKKEEISLTSVWENKDTFFNAAIDRGKWKGDLPSHLPSSHLSSCFVISIDDLFEADGGDLALRMVREASGGYDLGDMKKTFSLTRAYAKAENTAFLEAKSSLAEIEKKLLDLSEKEKERHLLMQELEAFNLKRNSKELWSKALTYQKNIEELKRLESLRQTFPDAMSALGKEDKETIEDYRKQERRLLEETEKTILFLKEVENKLNGQQVELFSKEMQFYIEQKIAHLQEVLKDSKEITLELEKQEIVWKETARFLAITEEDFLHIDHEEFLKLEHYFRSTFDLDLTHKELKTRLFTLEKEECAYLAPDLLKGLVLLENYSFWETQNKVFFFLIGLLSLAGSFLLFKELALLSGVSILLTAAISIFGLHSYKQRLKKSYGALTLPKPKNWTQETLKDLKETLRILLGQKERLDSDAALYLDVEGRMARVLEEKENLKAEYHLERLGDVLEKLEERGLSFFLTQLHHAEEEYLKLLSLRKRKENLDQSMENVLSELKVASKLLPVDSVSSLTDVQTLLKIWHVEKDRYLTLHKEKERYELELKEKNASLQFVKLSIDRFFSQRKISGDHRYEEFLRRFDFLEPFHECRKTLDYYKRESLVLEEILNPFPEIMEMNVQDLERELLLFEEANKRYEELLKRAGEIQAEIRLAEESNELSLAKVRLEKAKQDLRVKNEKGMQQILREFLLDKTAREYQKLKEPAVFEKAGILFSLFTHGKYNLSSFLQGSEPIFEVLDTVSFEKRPLATLSRGTRMQLVLAVRLAFATLEEKEIMPIFLDEAFHTSDTLRFDAIATAFSSLVKEGRQLFYFTSRHQDIDLWKAVAKREGLKETAVIDIEGHLLHHQQHLEKI